MSGAPARGGSAPRLVVDGHEDIAWNVRAGRDLRRAAHETRRREAARGGPGAAGACMLGLPDWWRGRVGVIGATLFTLPCRRRTDAFDRCYAGDDEAHAHGLRQLAVYRRLEATGLFRILTRAEQLALLVAGWRMAGSAESPGGPLVGFPPIGLVLLMENGDPIRDPAEVERWHEWGVRLVGPAWGASRYAGGTGEAGPLTPLGFELLRRMERLGMGLDLSHLTDQGFFQAVERYGGPVFASHSNPRAFVPGERQLSDDMIRAVVARDGVVGIAPINPFLVPGWKRGDRKEAAGLATVARAVDHVCQLAGGARHVALGTDFDGGFGAESAPDGLDTVADLPRLAEALAARGYGPPAIEAVFAGNWLRIYARCLG